MHLQNWIIFVALIGITAASSSSGTTSGSSSQPTRTTHTSTGAYSLHADDHTVSPNVACPHGLSPAVAPAEPPTPTIASLSTPPKQYVSSICPIDFSTDTSEDDSYEYHPYLPHHYHPYSQHNLGACYHPSGYSEYCAKVPNHYYALGLGYKNPSYY